MPDRPAYPSDLSDARWALIAPRRATWRQARTDAGVGGRPAHHDLREIFNAILYLNRTGIPWRYLPHDFPSWQTVYGYFTAWTTDGVFTTLTYDLTSLVPTKTGRTPQPTGSILDTQSIKTSTNVPRSTQGIDAGKKIVGRKRDIVTDTLGLLLAVVVTAASASDNTIGTHLLSQAKETHPHMAVSWADAGFKTTTVEHGARLGIDVQHVVERGPLSWPKTLQPKGSGSSNAAGSSNGPSDGSCNTAGRPETTKPFPTTRPA